MTQNAEKFQLKMHMRTELPEEEENDQKDKAGVSHPDSLDPVSDVDILDTIKVLMDKLKKNKKDKFMRAQVAEEVAELTQTVLKRNLDCEFRMKIFKEKIKIDSKTLESINLTKWDLIYKRVATLKPGATFGELALLEKGGKRAATVIADC